MELFTSFFTGVNLIVSLILLTCIVLMIAYIYGTNKAAKHNYNALSQRLKTALDNITHLQTVHTSHILTINNLNTEINKYLKQESKLFNREIAFIDYIKDLKSILTEAKLVVVYNGRIYHSFKINKDGQAVVSVSEKGKTVQKIVELSYMLDEETVYSATELHNRWEVMENIIENPSAEELAKRTALSKIITSLQEAKA